MRESRNVEEDLMVAQQFSSVPPCIPGICPEKAQGKLQEAIGHRLLTLIEYKMAGQLGNKRTWPMDPGTNPS